MSTLMSMENFRYPARNRMCLFGMPDPLETISLLNEQWETDRKRMIERWGFDILSEEPVKKKVKDSPKKTEKASKIDEENKENVHDGERCRRLSAPDMLSCEKSAKKAGKGDVTPNKEKRKGLKMANEKISRNSRQSQVTDFWRTRKFSDSSSCSEKEN